MTRNNNSDSYNNDSYNNNVNNKNSCGATVEVNSQLHAAADFTPGGNDHFIIRPILSSTNKSSKRVHPFKFTDKYFVRISTQNRTDFHFN
jgi:hypothetical protein